MKKKRELLNKRKKNTNRPGGGGPPPGPGGGGPPPGPGGGTNNTAKPNGNAKPANKPKQPATKSMGTGTNEPKFNTEFMGPNKNKLNTIEEEPTQTKLLARARWKLAGKTAVKAGKTKMQGKTLRKKATNEKECETTIRPVAEWLRKKSE